MKKRIADAVATGDFVRSMNKYVVEHRIDYVYGMDDSLFEFVAQHWGVSDAPYFPSFTSGPSKSCAVADIGVARDVAGSPVTDGKNLRRQT